MSNVIKSEFAKGQESHVKARVEHSVLTIDLNEES